MRFMGVLHQKYVHTGSLFVLLFSARDQICPFPSGLLHSIIQEPMK